MAAELRVKSESQDLKHKEQFEVLTKDMKA
jgi:hypothetical protein